ncbi:hypothetical protein B0I31_113176 [Saccharothrix carnea]|uniref:DDE superfamily endonuclease n=1 Tax=Saccharothrix carnea TaxID=1280637 RepID=A0A2P8I203_SACCR|nr:hypothetical protein B0I31_113176 [Saccharothrix carnea]
MAVLVRGRARDRRHLVDRPVGRDPSPARCGPRCGHRRPGARGGPTTRRRRPVAAGRSGDPGGARRRLRRAPHLLLVGGSVGAGAGTDAVGPGAAPPDPPRAHNPLGGRFPKHGGEFVFGNPTTWGAEDVPTRTDTRLYGTATAQAWNRMLKQTLGRTRPRLRSPEAADRWTWLILAAHAQLRLARPLVADLRHPWERPVEQVERQAEPTAAASSRSRDRSAKAARAVRRRRRWDRTERGRRAATPRTERTWVTGAAAGTANTAGARRRAGTACQRPARSRRLARP